MNSEWVAVLIAALALAVSAWSATLSWKSLKWERVSGESARRSAEAAERANVLTERALARGGIAASTLESGTEKPDVSWRIENPEKYRFILRNTGADIAEHVGIDPEQITATARNLPTDAVIRPGEGVDLNLMATASHPLPNQVYLRWAGSNGYEAVPLVSLHG